MLEQRRLDYLNAMGIVQWLPRAPLPHAPAPRWLPAVAQSSAAVAAEDVELPVFAAETPQKPKLELVKNPSANAELALPAAQEVPIFTLYFIGSELPVLWVCDNGQEVGFLQQFIFNVQKALLGQSFFVPAPQEFKWPFLNSKKHDQSAAVAKQALTAQWQVFQQQAKQPLQAVAIGAQSQHWLQEIDAASVFSADSVQQLTTSATLKRQLWLALLATLKP